MSIRCRFLAFPVGGGSIGGGELTLSGFSVSGVAAHGGTMCCGRAVAYVGERDLRPHCL